jgi:hypothetical protein
MLFVTIDEKHIRATKAIFIDRRTIVITGLKVFVADRRSNLVFW